jgi:hypothetical protein
MRGHRPPLDHLERLKGLFHTFLLPVSEFMVEFGTCRSRLAETTARLAALEAAHRDLAARHAAVLEDRDQRAAALDGARLDLGNCRNASGALQRLVESLSRENASRAAEIERLGAVLADKGRARAQGRRRSARRARRPSWRRVWRRVRTRRVPFHGIGTPLRG